MPMILPSRSAATPSMSGASGQKQKASPKRSSPRKRSISSLSYQRSSQSAARGSVGRSAMKKGCAEAICRPSARSIPSSSRRLSGSKNHSEPQSAYRSRQRATTSERPVKRSLPPTAAILRKQSFRS